MRSLYAILTVAAGVRAQSALTPSPHIGDLVAAAIGMASPTGTAPSSSAAAATSPGAGATGLPPGATPLQSPYTITALPAECTGDTAAYTAGFWVQGGALSVQDEAGLWGSKESVAWTFSTNTSNVVLGMPFFANGPSDPQVTPNISTRNNGNTFTINMSQDDGGQVMEFNVWNTNGTSFNGWNLSSMNQPEAWENVTYYMNIAASVPCAHPQGNNTCSTNNIERTTDAWSAFGVDEFLSSWLQNNSASFEHSQGMFQKFVDDFNIGGGKSCTIDNQCQLIDDCNQLPQNGTQENAAQVYLILIALQNLSDLFHQFHDSLDLGQGDTMTQIAQLSLQFHYLNGTTANTNPNAMALASGGLGLASSVLGLIPGLSDVTPFLGLVNSILGMANTATSSTSTFTFPDSQYAANEANIAQYLGQYVQSTRLSLENAYTSIFTDGTNLTQMLKGGQVVNRTAINLDCDSCATQSEINFEQYLAFKMVNEMWWQQNAFITFMPYGNITQVDTWETTTFTESDCASNFLTTDDDKQLTICHATDGDNFGGVLGGAIGPGSFLGPGMARLNWYWPGDPAAKGIGNPANTWGFLNISRGPPGYNSSSIVFNPSNGSSYEFKATDIIASSVAGFVQGGFNFDGVANAAQQIIDNPLSDVTIQTLQSMATLSATTPGMFSIPVCVLTDLNTWPTYWSTYNRVGGDYYSPCYGSSDHKGNKFEDNVSPDLRTIVTRKIYADGTTEPSSPGFIGSEGEQKRRRVRGFSWMTLI